MGMEIKSIEPHFIQVQYDISHATTRVRIMHKLRAASFAMTTQSVYEGPYSAGLMEELRQIAASEPNVDLKIRTPAYPEDQALKELAEYEQFFHEQFDTVQERLLRAEKAITGEELYHDKETDTDKPFTNGQVEALLNSATYDVHELEKALAKRKKYEADKNFEMLDLDLREKTAYIDKLWQSLAKRQVEAPAAQTGGTQQ